MDDFAYEKILKVQQIINELVGFLDAGRVPPPPADPPAFSAKWRRVAACGNFTLYVKGGDCPAQMTSDVHDAEPERGEDMKYLTKRKDGRWQGSKVIDGKREFVYAATQRESVKSSKNWKQNANASRSATVYMPLQGTGL